jgi:hypothetical protein
MMSSFLGWGILGLIAGGLFGFSFGSLIGFLTHRKA